MEKYGFVYLWYDKKHKRYYIGSHWGTEDDGYICSSRLMRQSYKRRTNDFKRRIIAKVYSNRKELLNEEERWLNMVDPDKTMTRNSTVESRKNVRYYNIRLGTIDHWWADTDTSLTVGQKISAAKKGKSTGPCSEETKAKIGNANRGRKFTDEHKEKLRQAKLGRKHTEEWKQENSKRLKEQWNNGTRSRQEISERTKNRWNDKGKSSFGH